MTATATDWQPIETAPRDGTEVLVWAIRAGLPGRLVAHYTSGGGEEQPPFGPAWFAFTGFGFSEVKPFLWQPLPAPPAPKGE